MVLAAGKVPEHPGGIFTVVGFSKDFPGAAVLRREDYHGVRGNKDFIGLKCPVKARGLSFRHEYGYFLGGSVLAKLLLEVIACIYRKVNVQTLKQLPPSGGAACKDDMFAVKVHSLEQFLVSYGVKTPLSLLPQRSFDCFPEAALSARMIRYIIGNILNFFYCI